MSESENRRLRTPSQQNLSAVNESLILPQSFLLLSGAIHIYETNAPEICRLLLSRQEHALYLAFDLIGETLYWLQEQFENELSVLRQS